MQNICQRRPQIYCGPHLNEYIRRGWAREATGGHGRNTQFVESFPIVWVTGCPLQMYASLVVLRKSPPPFGGAIF